MFKTTTVRIAFVITCLSMLSATASADTKVKSRQTSGGQTYENTSYIKGKRQRSETNNGQMITIQQCDLRRNIQLMPQMKMYTIQPYDQPSTTSTTPASTTTPTSQPVKKGGLVTSTVTTKDTGERKQMLGYTARHIITTMEMKSSPDACSQNNTRMEIDGWYIDATFALDCDSSRAYTNYRPHASGGCQDRYETKTIGVAKKGYPVWEKTTMFGPNGAESFSTITEVVEFSQATLDQSLFEIPEGYREVEDFASAMSAAYMNPAAMTDSPGTGGGAATVVPSAARQPAAPVAAKREGVIRFGVPAVKSGNVAEWMNAQNLAAAVQNTLQQNLKGTNVEAVVIEATGAGIQAEAQQKQCDYIVFADVSHKKGGGGFGSMLSSSVGQVASNIGYGSGTTAVVATNTVVAATVAQNIKAKDELTLDVRLERPTSTTPSFAQTFKGKAKSAGEDIITPLSQQAAQAIIASVGKG